MNYKLSRSETTALTALYLWELVYDKQPRAEFIADSEGFSVRDFDSLVKYGYAEKVEIFNMDVFEKESIPQDIVDFIFSKSKVAIEGLNGKEKICGYILTNEGRNLAHSKTPLAKITEVLTRKEEILASRDLLVKQVELEMKKRYPDKMYLDPNELR